MKSFESIVFVFNLITNKCNFKDFDLAPYLDRILLTTYFISVSFTIRLLGPLVLFTAGATFIKLYGIFTLLLNSNYSH
jgi:hypothetical protein